MGYVLFSLILTRYNFICQIDELNLALAQNPVFLADVLIFFLHIFLHISTQV